MKVRKRRKKPGSARKDGTRLKSFFASVDAGSNKVGPYVGVTLKGATRPISNQDAATRRRIGGPD
jgi:hypothetical protein